MEGESILTSKYREERRFYLFIPLCQPLCAISIQILASDPLHFVKVSSMLRGNAEEQSKGGRGGSNTLSGQHWKQPQNRRKFFTDFAAKSGFDPLVADNWYSIVKETIQAEKVFVQHLFYCYLYITSRVVLLHWISTMGL